MRNGLTETPRRKERETMLVGDQLTSEKRTGRDMVVDDFHSHSSRASPGSHVSPYKRITMLESSAVRVATSKLEELVQWINR